jgi:biotin carboxyl carrier protein
MASRTLTLVDASGTSEHVVEVLDDGRVKIGERAYVVRPIADRAVRIEGEPNRIAWTVKAGDVRWVFLDGAVYELTEQRPIPSSRTKTKGHHGSLTAPMPATVRRVLVQAGSTVKAGDPLVILEAMKMELPVRASAAGTIRHVAAVEGELVQPGVTLVELEPLTATDQATDAHE